MVDEENSARRGEKPIIAAPRRKISRTEWPAIGARHATGESLASIARDYRCTAPAIRYIVNTGRLLVAPSDIEVERESFAGTENVESAMISRPASPILAGANPGAPAGGRSVHGDIAGLSGVEKMGGFDVSLREGMTLEISNFLVALDAMVTESTPQTLNRLRDATDRLLRATARIRIELERGLGHPKVG